tara:strand:+ start:301 stop:801 length:501 start_codon:yes stop_codon:yes gene_type:complete
MEPFTTDTIAPPPSPILKRSYRNNGSTKARQMSSIQAEALELFKKKNTDYGDAFATYGTIGILVRMGDKLSRLQSITTNQVTLVDTEGLRDTLIDLHNYAAMGIMLLDNENKSSTSPVKKEFESDNSLTCPEMAWNFTKYKTSLSDNTKKDGDKDGLNYEELEEVD